MPSNDLASPRSVKLQLPSTVEEKVEEEPTADINVEIKKHITDNKPKRKTNFRASINRTKIQADTPHCLTSKKLFGRLDIIDKGFEFINRNPLVGLGLENSSLYTEISVHNPLILTWVENGIF